MPLGPIWLNASGTGLTQGVARHAVCASLSHPRQRTAGVHCNAKANSEADSSSSNLQSLLNRLATDASALANIVPLPIGRLRSDPQAAESPVAEAQSTVSAVPAAPTASADAQELETQLEEELKAQGQKKGLIDLLRHWRTSGYSTSDHKPEQDAHPVLELLQQRVRSGSKPGARTDSLKLGLAVEGGGMRGCVTAGGLRALHALGIRDCFDAVYGSSAGAMNLTYFLAQQPEGTDIYHEDIANERFCNMRRLLNRGEAPALDLEFLLHEVMGTVKPLSWEAVINSAVPLKVVASCLDTLQPVILDNFQSPEDLQMCLRASAQVPAVAGDPIQHRGRRLVDAAVFEPVPFRAAISDGCTHVVTLCSRPPLSGGWLGQMKEEVVAGLVKRAVLSPSYMKAAWARELENLRAFGLTTDQMLVASLDPTSRDCAFLAGSFNLPIIPGPDSMLSPVCIDAALLRAGIAAGEAAVRDAFGQQVEQPLSASEDSPFHGAGLVANGMESYHQIPAMHDASPQQQMSFAPARPARSAGM